MNGNDKLSARAYWAIGMMLFALFFGAGNLIFPAALGQQAGSNVGWALLGFVLTGVGLPLLGVAAMGYSSCKDVEELRAVFIQFMACCTTNFSLLEYRSNVCDANVLVL